MSHELECLGCLFIGIVGTLFYDYIKCNWEAKENRKKRRYPSVKYEQRN